MFKKIVSHFTLVCIINSSYVLPGMASQELLLDKNTNGQFVLKVDSLDMNLADLNLIDISTGIPLGALKAESGHLTLKGKGTCSFFLVDLPKLNSLDIELGASLIINSLVDSLYSLKVTTKGPLKLMHGFKIEHNEGFAYLKGAELTLLGESYANAIILDDLQQLVISKNACIKSKYLQTKGEMKVLEITNNGELEARYCTLDAHKLRNNSAGCLKFEQAAIDVKDSSNLGKIDISQNLNATGAWRNTESGIVTVGQLFQGNFSNYQDDGTTFVHGLALIKAEYGRLTGSFFARHGMIAFEGDLNVSTTAQFSIVDHLTLHSDASLIFNANIYLVNPTNQKEWPAQEIPKEPNYKSSGLSKGIFISGNKSLTRKGVVPSQNAPLNESTNGRYDGDGRIARSCFIENEKAISDIAVILRSEIPTYTDSSLQTKIAEDKEALGREASTREAAERNRLAEEAEQNRLAEEALAREAAERNRLAEEAERNRLAVVVVPNELEIIPQENDVVERSWFERTFENTKESILEAAAEKKFIDRLADPIVRDGVTRRYQVPNTNIFL